MAELPCLELLEATPAILRGLMSLILLSAPGTTGAELVLEQQRHQLELMKAPDDESARQRWRCSSRSEISEEDARWKPAQDRFSIAEVLAHLSHGEGHCYRARVDRFLAEEMPEFGPDDAQMHLDLYKNADPEEDFGHFEDQRKANVELLRGLPPAAGNRKALHRGAGEIMLSQMLHEWALHDLGHIRQVAELVRARKYLAGAGPLGKDYNLKP